MSFTINDYVRVKAGVTLVETGEPVPGWVGRVEKITPNGFILLELDAQSARTAAAQIPGTVHRGGRTASRLLLFRAGPGAGHAARHR